MESIKSFTGINSNDFEVLNEKKTAREKINSGVYLAKLGMKGLVYLTKRIYSDPRSIRGYDHMGKTVDLLTHLGSGKNELNLHIDNLLNFKKAYLNKISRYISYLVESLEKVEPSEADDIVGLLGEVRADIDTLVERTKKGELNSDKVFQEIAKIKEILEQKYLTVNKKYF